MSDNSIGGLVLAVVVGLVFAGVGGYMYYGQQQAIQNSEPVEATVLDTSVDREVSEDDDGQEVTFYARISYEYTYEGERYTSDNVRPAGISKGYDSRGAAEEFLSNYPEGSQVTAYHNPETDDAFLVKQTSKGMLIFAGVGGLVALFGAFGLGKKVLGLVA